MNQAMLVELTQDHIVALTNLDTATQSTRTEFISLTATNATLTQQLIDINSILPKDLAEVVRLKIASPAQPCTPVPVSYNYIG